MVASGKSSLTRYQQRKQEKCVLRTLENLPMKYDSEDSRSLATSYRSIRSASMDEAKWASHVSRNQLSESKRLFDDCLNKQIKEDKAQSEQASSRSEVGYRCSSVHSGPTRYGSPLYRRNPLNVAAHTRTPSEPPPKYFRAKSPIEDTLLRSNLDYQVSRRTGSKTYLSKAPTSYPNFLLIPNSQDRDTENVHHEERQSITPIHIMARRPYCKMKVSSLYPEPTVTIQDSMPMIKVDQVKGETKECRAGGKGSISSNTVQQTSHIKEIKETDGKEQGKGSSQLAVNVGCSKASSIKSSSSAQGKRDTCIPGDRFTTKSTHRRGGKKSSKSSSDTEIMKFNQPLLPNYICPSSEEKSREARIRHWLCESTFTCADRQVPLVF